MVFATQQCKLSSLIFFFLSKGHIFQGGFFKCVFVCGVCVCLCVFYITTGLENTRTYSLA